VTYLWQPDHGYRLTRACNLGIALCKGRVLVFLHGDMVPNTDLVRRHVAAQTVRPSLLAGNRLWRSWEADLGHLQHPRQRLMALRHETAAGSSDPECRRHEQNEQQLRRQLLASPLPWRACFGCHLSVPYSPAVSFDEHMTGWGVEDAELACRLHYQHGLPVSYDAGLIAWQVESVDAVYNVFRRNRHDELVAYLRQVCYFIDKYPQLQLDQVMTMGLDRLILTPSDRWVVVPRGHGHPAQETLKLARQWLASRSHQHATQNLC